MKKRPMLDQLNFKTVEEYLDYYDEIDPEELAEFKKLNHIEERKKDGQSKGDS